MNELLTYETKKFTIKSVALVVGMVLCWGSPPAPAGGYRCDEDASTCLKSMAQHLAKKGWVGIEIESDDDGGPMIVRTVMPDSPAEEFGFKPGDQLVSFNKISYSGKNRLELKKEYSQAAPGDVVTYVVERQGEEIELRIKLAAVPSTLMASWIGRHMMDHHLESSAGGAD